MNRKNAFIVTALLPRKMDVKMAFNAINAMPVGNSLQAGFMFLNLSCGMNIAKVNKPIFS